METPKIILRDPKELKPYEFNNKNHPKEQIDELVKSIKDDGFRGAITVDENDVIISGHGRVKACIELGIKVPTIKYTDMEDVQKIRNRIRDNRTNDLAEWNYENINHEISELQDLGDTSLDEIMSPFLDDLTVSDDEQDDIIQPNRFKSTDMANVETTKMVQLVLDAEKYVNLVEKADEVMQKEGHSTISDTIYSIVMSYNA